MVFLATVVNLGQIYVDDDTRLCHLTALRGIRMCMVKAVHLGGCTYAGSLVSHLVVASHGYNASGVVTRAHTVYRASAKILGWVSRDFGNRASLFL